MEVPGEFLRGKATQIKDPLYLVMVNFLLTYWVKSPETQVFCPSTHTGDKYQFTDQVNVE